MLNKYSSFALTSYLHPEIYSVYLLFSFKKEKFPELLSLFYLMPLIDFQKK